MKLLLVLFTALLATTLTAQSNGLGLERNTIIEFSTAEAQSNRGTSTHHSVFKFIMKDKVLHYQENNGPEVSLGTAYFLKRYEIADGEVFLYQVESFRVEILQANDGRKEYSIHYANKTVTFYNPAPDIVSKMKRN